MKVVFPDISGNSGQVHPIKLLEQLSDTQANGCLQVSNGSVEWLIYLHQESIIYATHSVDPFERLERHLRRLSHSNPKLTSEVRTQARTTVVNERNHSIYPSDYQAICWLNEQQYITPSEAAQLVKSLSKEVFESYLLLKEVTSKFRGSFCIINPFYTIKPKDLIEETQKRLEEWEALFPLINSPYQRPHLEKNIKGKYNLLSEQYQKFNKILIGFNFYQLAIILNQDELALAEKLYQLIEKGTISLREPQFPFSQLPKLSSSNLNPVNTKLKSVTETKIALSSKPNNTADSPSANKIVCVDDSSSMLMAIKNYLRTHHIEIFTINDPVKAPREIIQLKPGLILLDVGMPNLDGYQLCRMLRNYSLFKETPIVMVTGNTGFIDRTKAKLAGATDYLTKPFSQRELETIVFKYLNISKKI